MQNYNKSLRNNQANYHRMIAFCAFFLALFSIVTSVHAQISTETYHLVRIELSDSFRLQDCEANGVEIEHVQPHGNSIEVITTQYTVEHLLGKGVKVTILQADMQKWLSERIQKDVTEIKNKGNMLQGAPPSYKPGNYGGGYYRLQGIYDEFERMTSTYSNMLIMKQVIGKTVEQRDIVAYRITSPTKNIKTEVLYTALHHAREPGGASMLIYYLWWLLDNYGKNDEATYLLNTRDFWIIPVVNPDGYAYNESVSPSGGGLWRKNRRQFSATVYGVDLNRNYGPTEYWNAPNGGSSEKQEEDTYRGTAPFSEPETQAIRDFCLSHAFVIAHHYHTYGGLLIYPISATSQESPDSTLLRGLASEMTKDNAYSAGRDLQTVGYSVRGDADSWMYKKEQSKEKIVSLTTEAGTFADGFWAKPERITAQCVENLRPNIMIAWSARANVRPIMTWQTSDTAAKTTTLNIRIQNVGLAGSQESPMEIRCLSSAAQASNTTITIPVLAPAQSIEHKSIITALSGRNGERVPIEISITQDGVLRKDTVFVQIYKPDVIDMYKGEQNNILWSLSGWGFVLDKELNKYIIDESPNANYGPNVSHYASYQYLVDMRNVRSGSLQFTSRWNMDANYDFGVVQASTNFGATWIPLRSQRMKTGLGLSGSRQESNTPGFAGNYSLWTTLECSLDTLSGKQFFLRFGLLSDNFNNFDGWKIANAQLRVYRDESVGVEESGIDSGIRMYPNPSGNTVYISLSTETEAEILVSDMLGRTVLRTNLPSSASVIGQPLDLSTLSSGVYTVVVITPDGKQQRKNLRIVH